MNTKNKFILCIDTTCEGLVPSLFDENNRPVLFDTEREAQLEWADDMKLRIEAFKEGHMDFESILTDDFILPVTLCPDGTITCKDIGVLWQPA